MARHRKGELDWRPMLIHLVVAMVALAVGVLIGMYVATPPAAIIVNVVPPPAPVVLVPNPHPPSPLRIVLNCVIDNECPGGPAA